jgi:FtsZ-binding cell division protein ZapB
MFGTNKQKREISDLKYKLNNMDVALYDARYYRDHYETQLKNQKEETNRWQEKYLEEVLKNADRDYSLAEEAAKDWESQIRVSSAPLSGNMWLEWQNHNVLISDIKNIYIGLTGSKPRKLTDNRVEDFINSRIVIETFSTGSGYIFEIHPSFDKVVLEFLKEVWKENR